MAHQVESELKYPLRQPGLIFGLLIAVILSLFLNGCGGGGGGSNSTTLNPQETPNTDEPITQDLPDGSEQPAQKVSSSCLDCHAPLNDNNQHAGIEDAHPGDLSCTDCHGGDSSVATKEGAHILPPANVDHPTVIRSMTSAELDNIPLDYMRWTNPSDYRVVSQTCGQSDCHAEIARLAPSSIMTTFTGHFNIPLYYAGQNEERASAVGVRDQDAEVYSGNPGTAPAFSALTTQALSEESSMGEFMTHYLDKGCPKCHVWNFGPNDVPGDYRSSGCAGCHMVYSNDGLSQSADPTVNRDDPPHPITHKLTSAIPDQQCEHCHYRGNRIGTMFRGLRESGRIDEPPNTKTLDEPLHGHVAGFFVEDDDTTNDVDETPPDIHHTRGLACIDCHMGGDVHGDGQLHAAHDLQVGIECTDCHGTADQVASPDAEGVFRNSGGFEMNNLKKADCENCGPLLTSRLDGKLHVPPQVASLGSRLTSTEFKESHGRNEAGFSHMDNLECYTCHSSWTQSCFGCHITVDTRKDGKSLINGEMTPGKISGDRSWVVTDYFALGFNADGKITPMAPQEKMFFTAIVPCDKDKESCSDDADSDSPGKRVFNHATRTTSDGKLGMGFGPIVPHTVSQKSQPCDRCHLREDESNLDIVNELIGRGSKRFQIPDGDGKQYDLTLVLNEDDSPAVGLAHSGSDVLNSETITRLLKPRVADSGIRLQQFSDWVPLEQTINTINNSGDDNGSTGGPTVSAEECKIAASEPASVTLGTRTFNFKPLESGATLFIDQGAQGGGQFIYLALWASGIYPGSRDLGASSYPVLKFALHVGEQQLFIEQALERRFRIRSNGQLEFSGESILLNAFDINSIAGKPAVLSIELEDACGVKTSASLDVLVLKI